MRVVVVGAGIVGLLAAHALAWPQTHRGEPAVPTRVAAVPVVGAGIVGLLAAHALARRAHEVAAVPVVHAYGHGGADWTLAPGTGEAVADLDDRVARHGA